MGHVCTQSIVNICTQTTGHAYLQATGDAYALKPWIMYALRSQVTFLLELQLSDELFMHPRAVSFPPSQHPGPFLSWRLPFGLSSGWQQVLAGPGPLLLPPQPPTLCHGKDCGLLCSPTDLSWVPCGPSQIVSPKRTQAQISTNRSPSSRLLFSIRCPLSPPKTLLRPWPEA